MHTTHTTSANKAAIFSSHAFAETVAIMLSAEHRRAYTPTAAVNTRGKTPRTVWTVAKANEKGRPAVPVTYVKRTGLFHTDTPARGNAP